MEKSELGRYRDIALQSREGWVIEKLIHEVLHLQLVVEQRSGLLRRAGMNLVDGTLVGGARDKA